MANLQLEVPSSWEIVTLEEICGKGSYGSGASAIDFDSQKPRYIRITDINDDGSLNNEKVSPSTNEDDWAKNSCEPGDLLFARSGATVGKTFLYDESYGYCVYAGYLIRFRPNKKIIDPKFLFHFTKTKIYESWVVSQQKTVAQPNINAKQYGNELPIPLPPLGEQRRIAAVLDKADELRQKRRAALAKLDTLLQATFLHMFGDPVTNPMGWEKRPLGEIVEVQTGSTPSRKNAKNYGGTIPWVKTTEVDWGTISSTEETVTELGLKNARLKLYPKGSILVAMYGQGKTRGKSAILGIEATVNQACAVLLPSELLITEYLSALLKISYEELRNLGRGGNQPNLNLSLVRSFEIPLPKVQDQNKFAQFQRKIQMQSQNFEIAANNLDNLFHALQQRAFNGRL